MPDIILENVSVVYPISKKEGVMALEDVSCVFHDGDFNVLLGYSGSGKSSLLKAVLGLISYEGKIYFGKQDAENLPLAERNMGYVPQENVLYPGLTIFDNIALSLKNRGASREEMIKRVTAVADELGIKHCLSRKPKQISIGQQQKSAIARALVKNPDIMVFDEPFANLDAASRSQAKILLSQAIKKRGITALYVTHNFTEAMSLADRIFVIHEGHLHMEGKPLEVFDSPDPLIATLKGESDE